MPRLLGVDIPNDRPTVIALTYLYGVARRSHGLSATTRASTRTRGGRRDLREDELARLAPC